MELRQIQQFVVLAETLNFRLAAERLFMTQPPLSVSIKKLEAEIGVQLFQRSTHEVQLTAAGRAVFEEAKQALFHAAEMARIAKLTAQGLSGQLRIGFVGSARNTLLPTLLPLFRDRYPDVALKFVEENNTWILEALEANRIDIGIVRVPLTTRHSIEYRVLESDVFCVALPTGHRLAEKSRVSLRDLADEPFIQYTANDVPGLHAMTLLLFQEIGIMPRVAQEAVQVSTVLFLVQSGLGVALVPASSAKNGGERLVFRPLLPSKMQLKLGLALAFDPKYETATGRRFRDLAEAALPVKL